MDDYKNFVLDQILFPEDVLMLENSGAPRFTAAETRDAAITSPEEGQLSYVEGIGWQGYDGTAWVTLITNAGGSGNTPTTWSSGQYFSHWSALSGYQAPQYFKQGSIVVVTGIMKAGNVSPGTDYALVLPAGFRPAATIGFTNGRKYGGVETQGQVNIQSNGRIYPTAPDNWTPDVDWTWVNATFVAGG